MRKNNKGITLVALVVTIIVLIILVGISIYAIFGENGVIQRVEKAKELYGEKEIEEQDKLNQITNIFDGDKIKPTDIYVTLYTDGTLGFCSTENKIEGKTVKGEPYGNIKGIEYAKPADIPWYNERSNIKNVVIADKIVPTSAAYWFYGFTNLTTIDGLDKLDTSLVTNMQYMFYNCANLTSIDLNNFTTENVSNMQGMFGGCKGISSLDLSKIKRLYHRECN